MTLQVIRFYRNDKQNGIRDWWNGIGDPIEYLDMRVNEFCKKHKVVKIYHYPVLKGSHNQYFVIIYESDSK